MTASTSVLGRPRLLTALAVGVAALLAGCLPPPPPPPPPAPSGPPAPPVACTTAAPAAPLTADEAGDRAADAVRTEQAQAPPTDTDSVPLVVVEQTESGPEVTTVPVESEEQARYVAATSAADGDVVAVEIDEPVSTLESFPPGDPRFPQQWGLQSNKTTFGAAWARATGHGVVVAVLDTGVQASHPDLDGQVLPGRRFTNDGSGGVAMNPAYDDHGHGTHVAGIIGATTGNATGIAAGAPDVRILPVKVLRQSGSGSYSDVAAGIAWAANNGADVINLSLGGSSTSTAMLTAIKYARSKGAVVVAAAGNSGAGGSCSYPAAYSQTIAVAALTSKLKRATFSTTATYVDIAAPGQGVLSTVPGGYASWSGTSMATPFVSAAAALLAEERPGCSPNEVRHTIMGTARVLKEHRYAIGRGLVNPKRMLIDATC